MQYVIDSSQILANALRDCDAITTSQLSQIAVSIQQAIPSVYVDVSHHSVSGALEDYPTMFKRRDDVTIARAPQSEERFSESDVGLFFNEQIPDDIRPKFTQCVATISRQNRD